MEDQKINVVLPKDVIDAHIKAAMLDVLSKDDRGERLIEAVVQQAMTEKKERYHDKTILDAQLNQAIREAAMETFKAWIENQKEKISKAIEKRLKRSGDGMIKKIVDQIIKGFGSDLYVKVSLDLTEQPGETGKFLEVKMKKQVRSCPRCGCPIYEIRGVDVVRLKSMFGCIGGYLIPIEGDVKGIERTCKCFDKEV